jgi:uncharacterized iron-regulated protein
MKKIILFLTVLIFSNLTLTAQEKEAYKLYDKKNKETTYKKMLESLKDADIILFGELHNDAISHWMQYEISKDLIAIYQDKIVLGAEMFESDNQVIMNEYLSGFISEKKFEEEARLWKNHATDYKPLLQLAKENNLSFIATNIPRRYASMVYLKGAQELEKLSDEAKSFIAPLPFLYDSTLNCYKQLLEQMGSMPGHGTQNFPMSQAIKDATMSHFIYTNFAPEKKFIHYNGAYHSDYYESIYWYLKQKDEKLKIITISTVNQSDVTKLNKEHEGKADFVICVNENITKTH